MIYKEISENFTLVANDKHIRFTAVIITVFSVLLAIFFSPLAGIIIYSSYISGYIVCWAFIKYQNTASVYLQGLANFYYAHGSHKKNLKHSCSICDDLSCKRHQQTKSITPWKDLLIHEELNSAIQHFYNKILNNFIVSWYIQFTDDTNFINELRYCLRYASSTVINRFLEIDHARIISNKLLPCTIKHIDDYLYMQQIAKLKNVRFNEVVIEYLGKRLHVATLNRKNELSYLQHLATSLLPIALPEKYFQCRNYAVLIREILAGWVFLPLMDVLSDPNIINSLVILAITYKAKKQHKQKNNSKYVEFLENFIIDDNKKKSSFSTDLNTIKANTELLYAFMQFLKKEEHVHLLQFCLDIDEFNNRLLTPDLSKKQLEDLHVEALKIYKEYMNKDSLNFINCPNDISEDFYSLIDNGVYSVGKLRTSKPLFQAYEYTFNLLENVWLPAFFHSNEFYSQICGSKVTASYNKSTANRGRKYYESNPGTVSKISSGLGKIKGALKTTQPIEGSLYPPESQTIENGAEDIIISECSNIFRDLSTWRICILSYQTINKVVSFCINVQRLDEVTDDNKRHWIVARKDQDFYTLKAKLVEFHGENEICDSPLPSRKASNSLEMRMAKYEHFIQKLLQKPSLRGSDLLYTFLTTEEDFTLLISTSTPNTQDIGNIYQSVAHKLRKEKGQHLDSFMSTFLLSTGKSKQGKFEWAEMGDELDLTTTIQNQNPPVPKTFRNHVFNDNFGISYKSLKETSSSSFNPIGITECTFYLLKYIFKVPYYLLRLYAAVCNVAQQIVESFTCLFIDRKLKSSLSPTNLAYLIKLLEGVVFHPHNSPTPEEFKHRRDEAFNKIQEIVPTYISKIIGDDFNKGSKILLEILQHPHYNKQLAYNLIDIILIEMYPNLGKTKEN